MAAWWIHQVVLVLALAALAEGITLTSLSKGAPEWPSPGGKECSGRGTYVYQHFLQWQKDPLNFDLINGTTWSPVDRLDHTKARLDSVVYRSDLGTDAGVLPLAFLCEDIAEHEGFYDMIFEVLDNVDKFPPEQRKWAEMKMWVALSDHALLGHAAVADRGGPNAGVELMVKHLQANPEPYPFIFLGQLTLRYEIQMNLMGLLWHDPSGSRGAAAMHAGVAEELVHTLRTEGEACSPAYTACGCMNWIMMHNSSYVGKFKELGAPALAADAARRCAAPLDEVLMFELPYQEAHNANYACGYSATLFQSQ